jgi:hypothetical protein
MQYQLLLLCNSLLEGILHDFAFYYQGIGLNLFCVALLPTLTDAKIENSTELGKSIIKV